MDIFEIPASYAKDSIRFFRSPRASVKAVNFGERAETKNSIKYLGFAFLLTSAFVLVELKLIPDELAGPVAASVQKDELIFSYWVSTTLFVFLTHAVCRLLSGQGLLRASLAGLFRAYSYLIPATTLSLIVLSRLLGGVLDIYMLVTPPLGVVAFEPFVPSTANLLLVSGFLTLYFYLALFFLLCTLWTLREVHRFSFGRTLIATSLSVGALLIGQPLITFGVRKVFDVFEPLIRVFL